jgi:HPr kinase/phosphorylase
VTAALTAAQLHASAVAFECAGRWAAVLILGQSGAGKSELALELMAIGARLVADDQTCLRRDGAAVLLSAPETIRGLIELRGFGILKAPFLPSARLAVVVDMDEMETRRLPEREVIDVQGLAFPLLRNCASRAFASGLKQYILSEGWAPD